MEINVLACFLTLQKTFSFEIINVLFLIWESRSKELDDTLKQLFVAYFIFKNVKLLISCPILGFFVLI